MWLVFYGNIRASMVRNERERSSAAPLDTKNLFLGRRMHERLTDCIIAVTGMR